MTMIRVGLIGLELSAQEKSTCVDRLTEAFAKVEVGEDSELARTGFMVLFERFDRDDVWVGTKPMVKYGPSERAAVVTTHVMAGPWTDAMKGELFDRTNSIVREIAGIPADDSGWDFWMTFVEVEEGSWSVGGRTVSINQLAPIFTKDRQQRISAYLARRGGG